jgi:hypothetical protein
MNDNAPPEPGPPTWLELHPNFGDPVQLFNMLDWLQKVVEAAGAKMTGGSCGMGEADIDVELEGHQFNITIKPLLRREDE